MGAILLGSGERQYSEDDIDFEGSTITSSDNSDVEEERNVFVMAMPTRGLQRSVEASGFGKRTHGVLAYESSVERWRKCAKLDEQLDRLRALIPNSSAKIRERNDPCVVMDAYRYIATLQQQVEDLSAEVLEGEEDSCEERALSHHSAVSNQKPMVDLMTRDGVMEVRIVCANRPGLLVDVMEAVESRSLTVTHARIACHRDSVFKYLTLESEESATISLSTEGGSEQEDGEEELDSVKAMLVHAICEGSSRFDTDLQ